MFSINNNSYPFLQGASASLSFIQDIKIAIKKSKQIPYISAFIATKKGITIQLQTQDYYIGNWSFDRSSLWLNLKTEQCFGFIKLRSFPVSTLTCTGKFILHPTCYTFSVPLSKVKKLVTSSGALQPSSIMNISFVGDINRRLQQVPSCVNVGRASTQSNEYSKDISGHTTPRGIQTVNGIAIQQLDILSNDPDIHIETPIPLPGNQNYYVLYVNTTNNALACAGSSDSSSEV